MGKDDDPSGEADALASVLGLTDKQRTFVHYRWRAMLQYAEKRERSSRRSYYWARGITVVGAVILPALISLQLTGSGREVVRWIAFGLSIVVAVSTAIEGLFRNGQRWRLYRGLRSDLRSEGWRFAEHTGKPYGADDPAKRFELFAAQVERIISRYDTRYLADVAQVGALSTELQQSAGREAA